MKVLPSGKVGAEFRMMMPKDNLAGKIIVVTGGSSGIGAATVREFAALGATVVIGYHKGEERAKALLQTLPAAEHRIAQLELQNPASIIALAECLTREFGRLDVLVNSAGYTRAIPHADLAALDDRQFTEIVTANLCGPYAAIRALLPLLQASGEATIINVSSISGFTGSGSNIAYCAAKAALDNLAMSLGRALGPAIRVLSVSPGAVATDFVPGRDLAAVHAAAKSTPLRRIVEPEDVASAIVACVTRLRASTGIRIVVDGGRHL
jgi:3-oxoacyl-[acyl-carrier protein] reductase